MLPVSRQQATGGFQPILSFAVHGRRDTRNHHRPLDDSTILLRKRSEPLA
jgi:hypothetical protein